MLQLILYTQCCSRYLHCWVKIQTSVQKTLCKKEKQITQLFQQIGYLFKTLNNIKEGEYNHIPHSQTTSLPKRYQLCDY